MPFRSVEIPMPVSLSFDMSPYELPPDVWSSGKNVRFHNGTVRKMLGEEATLGNPPEAPQWLMPFYKSGNNVWLWAGLNKHYLWNGSSHADISNIGGHSNTNTPYFWQGDIANGIAIVTNDLDPPQMLQQGDANWSDLSNWPAGWTAKVIRPFKNRLIALNLNISGTQFPFRLAWSDATDPGLPPPNWDVADPASRAGETNLAEHDGAIIDGMSLRDQFLVYRENSVYAARFIGGSFSFQFYTLFESRGILNQGCVAEIPQGHFVIGPEDMYITDGRTYKIVGDNQVRDWFYKQIDSTNAKKVFCEVYDEFNEVWICFPSNTTQSPECDLALIYNYQDNSWTTRDLPLIRAAKQGLVESLGQQIVGPTWGDYTTENWDDLAQVQWGGPSSTDNPTALTLLTASTENLKFYQIDKTLTFDGVSFQAGIERFGVHMNASELVKHITRLVPRITDGQANIYVGGEINPGQGVFWQGPFLFTPGQQFDITCRVSGRYLAFRIESVGDSPFQLSGFAISMDGEGQR